RPPRPTPFPYTTLFRSERDAGGSGWHVAHRSLADKHIHALLIEPESGTVFAGVNHGSIFASADHGRTWEARDHGLTERDVYSLRSEEHTSELQSRSDLV